jgi:hypothetical protein
MKPAYLLKTFFERRYPSAERCGKALDGVKLFKPVLLKLIKLLLVLYLNHDPQQALLLNGV